MGRSVWAVCPFGVIRELATGGTPVVGFFAAVRVPSGRCVWRRQAGLLASHRRESAVERDVFVCRT